MLNKTKELFTTNLKIFFSLTSKEFFNKQRILCDKLETPNNSVGLGPKNTLSFNTKEFLASSTRAKKILRNSKDL